MIENDKIERLLDRYGIIVRLVDLPEGCRGTVKKHGAGYAVLIAGNMSPERQYRTLCHELLHILLGHLDDNQELSEEQKEAQVDRCLSNWAFT